MSLLCQLDQEKSRPLEVDAMLVNGPDVDYLMKQDTYGVMLKKLEEKFTKWKKWELYLLDLIIITTIQSCLIIVYL